MRNKALPKERFTMQKKFGGKRDTLVEQIRQKRDTMKENGMASNVAIVKGGNKWE
jgi:hypothetical protein